MRTVYSIIIQDWVIIVIAGIGILCMALILFYIVFTRIFGFTGLSIRQKMRTQGNLMAEEKASTEIPADHSAAIAMAIYLYNKVHDEESNILTIERKSRYYSPWSSKYYNMRKPIHYYRK